MAFLRNNPPKREFHFAGRDHRAGAERIFCFPIGGPAIRTMLRVERRKVRDTKGVSL